jgi:5-methylcytosine-specific restriction endonuclease McrA
LNPVLRIAFEQQGGLCFYCGRLLVLPRRRCDRGARNAATADHLTPQALGGTEALTNIVAACAACNVRKGMRRPTAEELARKAQYSCAESHYSKMELDA